MLTKWRLRRFKSVVNPVELEISPLTVFAGANSSGKSTVIQSMLLTAQTVQNPVLSRPIVLNGHIARLGAFTDIVSHSDSAAEIEIGFQLRVHPQRASAPRTQSPGDDGALTIDCDYSFSMRGSGADQSVAHLQPILEGSRLTVASSAEERSDHAEIGIRRSLADEQQRLVDLGVPAGARVSGDKASLRFYVTDAGGLRSDKTFEYLAGRKQAGALLQHFLPSRTSVLYESVETQINQIIAVFTEPSTFVAFDADLSYDIPVPDKIRTIIRFAVQEVRATFPDSIDNTVEVSLLDLESGDTSVRRTVEALKSLPARMQGRIAEEVIKNRSTIREELKLGREAQWVIRSEALPDLAGEAVRVVSDFFGGMVRYLGPLRDEPKPVYPLAGSADPIDVGFRGEHTAAVLDTHRDTLVHYISPSRLDSLPDAAITTAPLVSAVLEWLTYMGVAANVRTVDRGKLGHELKIGVSSQSELHDLTQVGVGVSQVLPLLVLSLLAPAGALLIFEQPELHLHPRVQTRLGDFFVCQALVGKQCVVETHSEYLISRLRYRAAKAKAAAVADAVAMYFVSKVNGQSVYERIRINEYGAADSWPAGFFDEGETNAAEVLKAGIEKRRASVNYHD